MTSPSAREPVFNIPGVVAAMLGLIVIVHLGRQLLSEMDDNIFVLAMAFIADRYTANPADWPGGALSAWTSPVTHLLVHGDVSHLALNGASLAAFGAILARRIGSLRFIAFTLVCGGAGALAFLVFNWGLQAPLIGASGAIAGMMAIALRLLFSAIDASPPGIAGEVLRRAPHLVRLKSLSATLADRRMQFATGIWLGINLLAAYGFGTPAEAGVVAWEAHIGGFFTGLALFGLFDRQPAVPVDFYAEAIDGNPTGYTGPNDPV